MHFDALFLQFFTRSVETRASINLQARWIAGSSPAMTLCKSIIAPFATPL